MAEGKAHCQFVDEDQGLKAIEDKIGELTPISPRQAAFVSEYLVDLNATQAAIRAGYNPNSAAEQSCALLNKLKYHIERGKAQRLSRVEFTQDQVLQEMSLLANSSVDHYYVDDEGQVKVVPGAPDGAMRAIQSIKRRCTVRMDKNEVLTKTYDVEIKLWDKPQPLKLMGRHVGLFPDKVEVTGKNGGPLEIVTRVERVIVDPPKEIQS